MSLLVLITGRRGRSPPPMAWPKGTQQAEIASLNNSTNSKTRTQHMSYPLFSSEKTRSKVKDDHPLVRQASINGKNPLPSSVFPLPSQQATYFTLQVVSPGVKRNFFQGVILSRCGVMSCHVTAWSTIALFSGWLRHSPQ
jgi:hypothetical protein